MQPALPVYAIFEEGGPASVTARAFGRKMIAVLAAGKLRVGQIIRSLSDGTTLIAQRAGTQYRLTITTPSGGSQEATDFNALWLPRGFVVYPSSATSTSGWGAPVMSVGINIFAHTNIAPGLEIGRWTAGGGLGEVLLTQQVGNGYPAPTKNTVPLEFSLNEAPAAQTVRTGDGGVAVAKKNYAPPKKGPWTAYRVEFDGWQFATGQGSVARRSLFKSLNSGREYLLPIRGYYDAAARDVIYAVGDDFSGSPWTTDGDLGIAPAGYRHAADRKNKDGVVDPESIDTITRALDSAAVIANLETEAQLGGSHFEPHRTSLNLGIAKGFTALAAVQRSQWIAYGNRQWLPPIGSGIPVVSWDGFCSYNLPASIQFGTIDGDFQHFTSDYDTFMYTVRGVARPIFSKRVYANGRVLGELPDFVMSVGVQTTAPQQRRIVVLTSRLSDQSGALPYSDLAYIAPSMARVYRVYFLDVPDRHGVVLAPSAPAIGLFDATTNPGGWHYAGSFALFEPVYNDHHLAAPAVWQLPVFDRTGTRSLAITNRNDGETILGMRETVFGEMGDGVLSATTTLLAKAGTFGADYADDGTIFYFYWATINRFCIDIASANWMRWSGETGLDPSNGTAADILLDRPCDLAHSDAGEGTALYVTDPVRGRATLLRQPYDNVDTPASVGFYVVEKDGAGPVSEGPFFADGFGLNVLDSEGWRLNLNEADVALIYRVRDRDGNWLGGYEIAQPPHFVGAVVATSIGDLPTLTATPGGGRRYYPAGVV